MTAVTAVAGTPTYPRTSFAGRRGAHTAGVACALTALLCVGLHLVNGPSSHTQWWVVNGVLPLVTIAPGVVVARRRPEIPIGWLILLDSFTEALCGAGREYGVLGLTGHHAPLAAWVGWACDSLYLVDVVCLPVLVLLLPTGRPMRDRSRWLLAIPLVVGPVALVSAMLSARPEPPAADFFVFPAWRHVPTAAFGAVTSACELVLVGLLPLLLVWALVHRYRRSDREERQQLKWVAYAGVLLVVELTAESTVLSPGVAQVTASVAQSLVLIATAIAVVRHRMFDIDVVINRTVVYVTLTAGVVAAYAALVSVFDLVLGQPVRLGPGLVATAILAFALHPARQVVQRAVDRLLYGERRNPYGAMAALGERIGAGAPSDAPDADLAVIVETLTGVLRLPHAALLGEDDEVVAQVGTPTGSPVTVPLVHGGAVVGRLVVSPRTGSRFAADEQRLVRDLARQIAAAVHAVRLSTDLQRSRRTLVTAKEEERRRLRNDLHDGLGPKLAALGLKLDAARLLVDRDPRQSQELLDAVKHEIRSTIDDIRRLVYDLRPPTLDELGLPGAVRDLAARLAAGGGPLITVVGEVPPLPAATEVAAFRIVGEALTNVVRHADARRCEVTLAMVGGDLHVRVADDGRGRPVDCRAGVGTRSMHERASEIGGAVRLEPGLAGRGSSVAAQLPATAA